jgi:hypothetical protein
LIRGYLRRVRAQFEEDPRVSILVILATLSVLAVAYGVLSVIDRLFRGAFPFDPGVAILIVVVAFIIWTYVGALSVSAEEEAFPRCSTRALSPEKHLVLVDDFPFASLSSNEVSQLLDAVEAKRYSVIRDGRWKISLTVSIEGGLLVSSRTVWPAGRRMKKWEKMALR